MRPTRRVADISSIASGRIPLVSLVQTLLVAEHLNFRHAARSLGVTQSSVSIATIFKNPAFASEKEWRLVSAPLAPFSPTMLS